MAYFDPHSAFFAPRGAVAAASPDPARFSGLEWTVILLAAGDTLASLRTPGRLSRALGNLFGLGTKSRLADPRLEALRRVAVHAWRQVPLPVAEAKRFIDAGFDLAQLRAVAGNVAALTSGDER